MLRLGRRLHRLAHRLRCSVAVVLLALFRGRSGGASDLRRRVPRRREAVGAVYGSRESREQHFWRRRLRVQPLPLARLLLLDLPRRRQDHRRDLGGGAGLLDDLERQLLRAGAEAGSPELLRDGRRRRGLRSRGAGGDLGEPRRRGRRPGERHLAGVHRRAAPHPAPRGRLTWLHHPHPPAAEQQPHGRHGRDHGDALGRRRR
mmetsp:Transcript_114423/g.319759  ORF Transcript_114423/g.319759 Transcript_114423/m.319759 type:complete len:203 (-) Transcript_114423:391-999(-)